MLPGEGSPATRIGGGSVQALREVESVSMQTFPIAGLSLLLHFLLFVFFSGFFSFFLSGVCLF